MPPCEQQSLEGQGFSCLRVGYVGTSDDTWHTLLQDVLIWYIKLLTNPEGPAQSAPTLTRKEIIERSTTRKESRAAAITRAAAADGGDGGGDGGRCGSDAA